MQEHNFDEILDYLCEGILLKNERESVRDELYDHLMCRYETNLAVGMDEETAKDEAIKNLGEASVIRHQLGAVHPYAPRPTLKKAMNLLVFGYILSSFHIDFFTGMKEITTFIGVVAMLVSLFCLAKANKKLKTAFVFRCVSYVLAVASTALQQWGFSFTLILTVAEMLPAFVSLVLLINGLAELVKPFGQAPSKKVPFTLCIISNAISGAVTTYMVIVFNGAIDELFVNSVLFALLLVNLIITVVTFSRVSRFLWNSDHEYRIEDSAKKKTAVALAVLFAIVVPVVVSDYIFSTQKAQTEVYSVERGSLESAEREEICNNLLSYGIPDYVVSNLPDSELEMYRGCLNAAEFADETWDLVNEHTVGAGGVRYTASFCGVGLRDEDGNEFIRVLMWARYKGDGSMLLCNSLFWEFYPQQCLPFNYAGEYNEDFLLLLSEENGKTLKNEPLAVYTNENALTDSMTGVRFQMKGDITVIRAASYYVSNTDNAINCSTKNYYKCFPVNFLTRKPLDFGNSASYNALEYERCLTGHQLVWEYPPAENE